MVLVGACASESNGVCAGPKVLRQADRVEAHAGWGWATGVLQQEIGLCEHGLSLHDLRLELHEECVVVEKGWNIRSCTLQAHAWKGCSCTMSGAWLTPTRLQSFAFSPPGWHCCISMWISDSSLSGRKQAKHITGVG